MRVLIELLYTEMVVFGVSVALNLHTNIHTVYNQISEFFVLSIMLIFKHPKSGKNVI